MSRIPTLLTKTALAAGAISLSVLSPDITHAQCSQADLCSPSACSALQKSMHPACDQHRSCTKVNANNKQELVRRLLINQLCLAAREDVARCFSKSDPGHEEAIQSVENAIDTCRRKLN